MVFSLFLSCHTLSCLVLSHTYSMYKASQNREWCRVAAFCLSGKWSAALLFPPLRQKVTVWLSQVETQWRNLSSDMSLRHVVWVSYRGKVMSICLGNDLPPLLFPPPLPDSTTKEWHEFGQVIHWGEGVVNTCLGNNLPPFASIWPFAQWDWSPAR